LTLFKKKANLLTIRRIKTFSLNVPAIAIKENNNPITPIAIKYPPKSVAKLNTL